MKTVTVVTAITMSLIEFEFAVRMKGFLILLLLDSSWFARALGVLGLVDHTHATAAEFFNDAVVGDGCADHLPFSGTLRRSSSKK